MIGKFSYFLIEILQLNAYNASGAIKTVDAFNGLRDKLIAAKVAIQRRNIPPAINQLQAFQSQLTAADLVNMAARQAMLTDSQTLISNLRSGS